jgi:integrin beta 3
MTLDLQAFAVELATETKSYVRQAIDAAVGDLRREFAAGLDTIQPVVGPMGVPGPAGPPGQDGKDVDAAQMRAEILAEMRTMLREMVREEMAQAMATLPAPRDGRDGKDVDVLAVKTLVEAAVTAIPSPDLGPLVRETVTAALASRPLPKDGKDGINGIDGKDGAPGMNGKDGRDGIDGKDGLPGVNGKDGRDGVDGKDGAPGLNGKDGAGVVSAFIDRDEHLVVTLSDGSVKDCGVVVGKSVDPADVVRSVEAIVATWERPKDGKDGIDGKDGLGFDDFSVGFDEVDGYALKYVRGDEAKRFRVAWPWYAGVWQSGRRYPAGAKVTSKGAEWTAKVDTFEKPGESRDWQMSAKGGRDGKDAPGARDAE